MFKYFLVSALGSLFALLSTNSYAFFDVPYTTPSSPAAGETVSVVIHGGVCDTIIQWPGYPQITHEGNEIRLVNYGHHWPPGDLCTYPIGTATFPIGSFTPGNYVVTVDLNYLDFFSQPQTLTLGVVTFTVAGIAPPAVPAPTLGPLGLLALLLVLSGLALWTLRSGRAGMLFVIAIASSPLTACAQSAQRV